MHVCSDVGMCLSERFRDLPFLRRQAVPVVAVIFVQILPSRREENFQQKIPQMKLFPGPCHSGVTASPDFDW